MIAALFALLAGTQEPPLNCRNPRDQLSMNQCAARRFAEADRALNRFWPQVLAYVRAQDEGIEDGSPSGEDRLRDAQRAWIAFRDAHCAVAGNEMRGGSAEPLLYESCRAQTTRARIAQLRALMRRR